VSDVAVFAVRRLREAGARAIFGVPGGGGNLDLVEAAGGSGLPFVLTATETGSALAAMAQAEITGRPGACLTTLGPGAASVVNGVACASLDRAPLVVFTDSHPVGARAAFAHQRLDHRALLAPVTKWSGRLEPGRARRVMEAAFAQVLTVPPGPVHVDCPADVTTLEDEATGERPVVADAMVMSPVPPLPFEAVVSRARKPVLLVGLGARQPADADAVRRLCEQAQVPAMVTYKAKGVLPDDHPSFAGVFINGALERALVEESDAIVGIGLDPVELLPRPWTYRQPIVSIGRWRAPADHVPWAAQWVTEVPTAAAALGGLWGRSAWDLDRVTAMRRAQWQAVDFPAPGLTPQRVVTVTARMLAATSRVTIDAGAHMFPATLGWPVRRPNDLLISNGLSTMGFALPAAIGAALLDRTRPVVALTGDGGLLMCAGELATAAREQVKVMTVVFSDASLSLIALKQQARRLRPAGLALGPIGWRALGESLGVASFAATTEDELARAVSQAAAADGPTLIEAAVDRSTYGPLMKVLRG